MISLSKKASLVAVFTTTALIAHAQNADTSRLTTPVTPKPVAQPVASATDGTLSLDDLEDIGPVHALDQKPAHQWFEAGVGLTTYFTDNAAQLESKTATDVAILSAHAGVNAKPIAAGEGRIDFRSDYSYAALGYGHLTGRADHDVATSTRKLGDLDFQAHTVKVEGEYTRHAWSATTGLRYASFLNTASGDREYTEWSPYVSGGRRFTTSASSVIDVAVDADYRFSDTPIPGFLNGLVKDDMNDRYDLGLTVAYTQLLGEHWFVQPVYRYAYAGYTEGKNTANKGRGDHTHTVTLAAGYTPTSWLTARVYTSWEARDSNEASIADYRTLAVGAGLSATAKF